MRITYLLPILVISYVIYGLSLTLMSYDGFPDSMQDGHVFPYLADKPVGEDGYYMLTVAWNLANGDGITYNFGAPTTGVQPLSTFIYALIAFVVQFIGGDKWTFIRSVLAFGIFNLVIYSHFVGSITRTLIDNQKSKDTGYALGFAGTLFSFALFRTFTYGLETGIYLTLFAILILHTLRLPQQKLGHREVVCFGVFCGITAWARIDFSIILFVFLIISMLRKQISVFAALIASMMAMVIISPWFLRTFIVTGNWMPSSGAAQSLVISAQDLPVRFWRMMVAILGHLTPWFYSNGSVVFIAGAFLSFSLFVVLVLRKQVVASIRVVFVAYPYLSNWFAGVAILILVYLFFFWATHFYQRYSSPILPILTPIMAVAVTKRIESKPKLNVSIILSALAICFFGWAYLSLHTGRIFNSHTITAGYVEKYFSFAKVGAYQSGVVGYFNPNVINLDGKANQAVLSYSRNEALDKYIDLVGIDILVDWPGYITSSLDNTYLTTNWDLCEVQIQNDISICLRRKSVTRRE